MSTFIQTLIVGLRLGSIYALVALGYTMVYGIIRLINFAHGDFIMVGGYAMIFTVPLVLGLGLPCWPPSRYAPWWAWAQSSSPTAPCARKAPT